MQLSVFESGQKRIKERDLSNFLQWKPAEGEQDYRTQFQTPIPVAQYMAGLLPKGVKTVLEPTPGVGNIVECLKGYDVTAPKDFFTLDRTYRYDAAVLNPPFSTKYAFNVPDDFEHQGMRLGYFILTECMNMSDIVIALMPWFTISDSDARIRNMKAFGLRSITHLPRKTFQYARIQTCVLFLEKGFLGETEFKVFQY